MRRFSAKPLFLLVALCLVAVCILPTTLSTLSSLGSHVLYLRDTLIHSAPPSTGWTLANNIRLSIDVNGDNLSDLVGFGDTGVFVSLSRPGGTFSPILPAIPNFGYSAGGWRKDRHVRLMGDVNGDGRADIVGFGADGVYTALGQADGTFSIATKYINNFAYNAGGWRVDKHLRMLGDVNGDGRMDIVAFGGDYVFTAMGQADGSFGPIQKVLKKFAYNANSGNWRIEKHVRLLGDVNGDGRADIIAFGDYGVKVALGQPDGTFSTTGKIVINNLAYVTGGWRVDKHPRLVGDINGDGRDDIVAFGHAGVFIALGQPDGTFTPPVNKLKNFAYGAGGWRVDKHVRMLADVNGDGRQDIVACGGPATFVALGQENGTLSGVLEGVKNFAYSAGGWRNEKHVRVMADSNGDGRMDLIGFGNRATFVGRGKVDGRFDGVVKVLNEFGYEAESEGMGVVKEQRPMMGMDVDMGMDMGRVDNNDGGWWMRLRQWFGMDGGEGAALVEQ